MTSSPLTALHKVVRIHSGEEFTADDFPTLEDGRAALEALGRVAVVVTHSRRLYERVQMDESVGVCLSSREECLALGDALLHFPEENA